MTTALLRHYCGRCRTLHCLCDKSAMKCQRFLWEQVDTHYLYSHAVCDCLSRYVCHALYVAKVRNSVMSAVCRYCRAQIL